MGRVNFLYRCLRSFVRLVTNGLYYRRVKVVGRDNVPSPGTPTIIASNHFNGLNDALAILLSVSDRKPGFMVRADVFENRVANRFLRSIGLLPAYRLDFDGAGYSSSNFSTFSSSENMLINGGTVVMFPQAGHSAGYWMDEFTGGMAKMAFEAASLRNFEKEILITPSCNYYRDVFGFRSDMLVQYAEPVKVSQFYSQYRAKPYTAIRRLNALIKEKIEGMMLNITDREHYDEIRFLLEGGYVSRYALRSGMDNSDIEGNLKACREIVCGLRSALEKEDPFLPSVLSRSRQSAGDLKGAAIQARRAAMNKAGVSSAPKGPVASVFDRIVSVESAERSLGLEDIQFDRNAGWLSVLLRGVLLAAMLPLAVVCLWPSALIWCIPAYFSGKVKDKLFGGTFFIALNVLAILPLTALATLLAVGLTAGILPAILYVALFPLLFLFECFYFRLLSETGGDAKRLLASRSAAFRTVAEMRERLFSELDGILK